MSAHGRSCADVLFARPCPCPAGGEVALEDYARALFRAGAAEALAAEGDPGRVRGVHLCGVIEEVAPAAVADLEAFAREMAERSGGGLGWS